MAAARKTSSITEVPTIWTGSGNQRAWLYRADSPQFGVGVLHKEQPPPNPVLAVVDALSTCKAYINEQMSNALSGKGFQAGQAYADRLWTMYPRSSLEKPVLLVWVEHTSTKSTATRNSIALCIARAVRWLSFKLVKRARTKIYHIVDRPGLYAFEVDSVWFHNPVLTSFLTTVVRDINNSYKKALKSSTRAFILGSEGECRNRLNVLVRKTSSGTYPLETFLSPDCLTFFGGKEGVVSENWPLDHELGICSWLSLVSKPPAVFKSYRGSTRAGSPIDTTWMKPAEVAKKLGL